jgi:hypothetical protein
MIISGTRLSCRVYYPGAYRDWTAPGKIFVVGKNRIFWYSSRGPCGFTGGSCLKNIPRNDVKLDEEVSFCMW